MDRVKVVAYTQWGYAIPGLGKCGGFLSHRATPKYHPSIDGFSMQDHPEMGNPDCGNPHESLISAPR